MKTLLIALLIPMSVHAMDFDVEWPTSNSKEHTLVITIDKCETKFKIKTEDLQKFEKSDEALNQAVDLAMKHTNNGCR